MIRTNIYLTKRQLNWLKQISKVSGLSVAEHIRRAIDSYIKDLLNEQKGNT